MSDSTEVKVTSSSPALPAPAPPTVAEPTWSGKTATFAVVMPTIDVNGQPVEGTLSLKYKVVESGGDSTGLEWQTIAPGAVEITVPKWATAYDFVFEVSNE